MVAKRTKEISQATFIRALILLSLCQRLHLPISSPWGMGFQHMNFAGTQNFGPMQHLKAANTEGADDRGCGMLPKLCDSVSDKELDSSGPRHNGWEEHLIKWKHYGSFCKASPPVSQFINVSYKPVTCIIFFCSFFNWSIANLQCCVSFRYRVKWFIYTYIYYFSDSFHYRLLQDIEYSSPCSTIGPCCLRILYIVVRVYVNPRLLICPPHLPPSPVSFLKEGSFCAAVQTSSFHAWKFHERDTSVPSEPNLIKMREMCYQQVLGTARV